MLSGDETRGEYPRYTSRWKVGLSTSSPKMFPISASKVIRSVEEVCSGIWWLNRPWWGWCLKLAQLSGVLAEQSRKPIGIDSVQGRMLIRQIGKGKGMSVLCVPLEIVKSATLHRVRAPETFDLRTRAAAWCISKPFTLENHLFHF